MADADREYLIKRAQEIIRLCREAYILYFPILNALFEQQLILDNINNANLCLL